jgi:hypothetical protein
MDIMLESSRASRRSRIQNLHILIAGSTSLIAAI